MVYQIDTITTILGAYLDSGLPIANKNSEVGIGDIEPVNNQRGFVDYSSRNANRLWSGLHREMFNVTLQTDTIAKLSTLLAKIDTLSQQYRTGVATAGLLETKVSAIASQLYTTRSWANNGIDFFDVTRLPWTEQVANVQIAVVGGLNVLKVWQPVFVPAVSWRFFPSMTTGTHTVELWWRREAVGVSMSNINVATNIKYVVNLELAAAGTAKGNGNPLVGFNWVPGQWYCLKITWNMAAKTYDLSIDGVVYQAAAAFLHADAVPDRVWVSSTEIMYVFNPSVPGNDRNEKSYARMAIDRHILTTWTVTSATLTLPVTGFIASGGGNATIHGIRAPILLDSLAQVQALIPTAASIAPALVAGNNVLNVTAIMSEIVAAGDLAIIPPKTGFLTELNTPEASNAMIGSPTLVMTLAIGVDDVNPYQLDVGSIVITWDGNYWNIDFTVDGYWKLV